MVLANVSYVTGGGAGGPGAVEEKHPDVFQRLMQV